jgi:tryptophan 2,3-dioxygenase
LTRDYSVPVLTGGGANDYTRYMQTDTLLSLQRPPEVVIHRDELLFQVVHQSTELWLKLACAEVAEAIRLMLEHGELDGAARLLGRASLSVVLCTDQLEMMRHLSPWDFQTIRTVLGHGSGFESPGWKGLRAVSDRLGLAFAELVDREKVDLAEIYRSTPDVPVYRLAEAMIDLDERISVWRVQHFKMATRVIGHAVTGTKGTPIDVLARLIGHKFFPQLWQVRTDLTRTGPMADNEPAVTDGIPT